MARKRNDETVALIERAVRELLLELGLDATSYTLVAERTGVPRTTVQHYFPSKETFAARLMSDIQDTAYRKAFELAPVERHPLAVYYLAAQFSMGMIWSSAGLRQLLLDITTNRNVQNAVAPNYLERAFEEFSIAPPTDEELFDLQFAIEGAYGIYYLYLKDGKTPHFARFARKTLRLYAKHLHMDKGEYDAIVQSCTRSNEELLALGREFVQEL